MNKPTLLRLRARAVFPLFGLVTALWLPGLRAQAAAPQATPRKVAAPTPPAGSMFLYPERIPLEAGGLTSAERGVIFVPVNRNKPGSAVISLDVYRFKAVRPEPGAPPIFLLYGGPSFGGLEPLLSRRGYYEKRLQSLHQTADLVVVSQRGIGPSKPTTWIEIQPPFPLDRAVSDDERIEAVQKAARREKAFWIEQGLDLGGFTVLEAAADLDDVRKAFGYERIVLWGGSFGSHWAMATMRRFPQIVERAVLRGMEGPDHTYDMPSHVLNSIKRLAAEADAAPALEGLVPSGGMMAAFEKVIERVTSEPVVVSLKDPKTGAMQRVRFGPEDVRGMAFGYTATAQSRNGMRTWASDVLTLYRGDFTAAAEQRLRDRQTESFRTASFYMLDCGSGITPARSAQIAADPAVAIVGPLGFNYRAACPVWEIDLGDAFRQNFDTQIPTVIAQGDYDVSTPLENALELAPHFKRSRFVVVHGGSHPALDDAMDASPEFAQQILTFARTGDMSSLPSEVKLPPIQWVLPR
ncbi:MAG: alpha/beta hydrolase [Vicinamibacteria bacterium]|nr:alpha/beta hydrolase [Vicinamibacteria bacterium]